MLKVRGPEYTAAMDQRRGELAKLGFYHSIELPDGTVIPGAQSIEQQRWRIAQFPIPQDLRGKRVLDIGAWDGWFSFEMERRGATVVAVDATNKTKFREAKELMGSKVEHIVADICRLKPSDIGTFDIVLFLGVLYHLKHPMLAIENVCELSTDLACVESFVTDDVPDAPVPSMEFYEHDELAGQFDNWVGPNISCVMAMCRTAGFARVEFKSVANFRAHIACHRKWAEVERTGAAPALMVVENSELQNHSFTAHHDDYVAVWFSSEDQKLTCDDVQVRVGPFGTRPAGVRKDSGTAWQANCRLPLGLAPGWHEVSVAIRDSQWSNRARIPVDLPRQARIIPPAIIAVENSELQNHSFTAQRDDYITVWISSEEPDLTCDDILVQVTSFSTKPMSVSNTGTTWQARCQLPPGLAAGWHDVSVTVRNSEWSNRARIPVDLPREERFSAAPNGALEVAGVCDARTWTPNKVRAGLGSCVSAWVIGMPDGVARTEVSFRLDGTDLPASFLAAEDDEKGMKQINAIVPAGLERGEYQLTVRFRDTESRVERIELV
jgi:tRNA (mo5U34)-methyltransferase